MTKLCTIRGGLVDTLPNEDQVSVVDTGLDVLIQEQLGPTRSLAAVYRSKDPTGKGDAFCIHVTDIQEVVSATGLWLGPTEGDVALQEQPWHFFSVEACQLLGNPIGQIQKFLLLIVAESVQVYASPAWAAIMSLLVEAEKPDPSVALEVWEEEWRKELGTACRDLYLGGI
jgi:hypothetical protein